MMVFLKLVLGCLTTPAEHRALQIVAGDADGDGYAAALYSYGDDCDDQDASVNPGVVELPYNGKDDDCDGRTPDDDLDGDGYGQEDDCDDFAPRVNPGVEEVWYDGVDQNCDGNDADADMDGEEWVEVGGLDCDDTDAAVQMRSWYVDADHDGYGDEGDPLDQCEQPEGRQALGGDCNDSHERINPAQPEVCDDGLDNDCSGDAPECLPDAGALQGVGTRVFVGHEVGDEFGHTLATASFEEGDSSHVIVGDRECVNIFAGDSSMRICDEQSSVEELEVVANADGEELLVVAGGDGILRTVSEISVGDGSWSDYGNPVLSGPPDTDVVQLLAGSSPFTDLYLLREGEMGIQVAGYAYAGDSLEEDWGFLVPFAASGTPQITTIDLSGSGAEMLVTSVPREENIIQLWVLSPVEGTYLGAAQADSIGTQTNTIRSTGAADINGDGWEDLLFGAPQLEGEGGGVGYVYVMFGPSLQSDTEYSDVVLVGGPDDSLGSSLCTIKMDDGVVVYAGLGTDLGGVSALSIREGGTYEASELWTLRGAEGAEAAVNTRCSQADSKGEANLLLSQYGHSATTKGEVVLLPLHEI